MNQKLTSLISAISITSLVVAMALFMVYTQKSKEQQSASDTPSSSINEAQQAEIYVVGTVAGKKCELEFTVSSTTAKVCADSGCTQNSDCGTGLECTTANNGTKYCTKPSSEINMANCKATPNDTNCCNAEQLECGEEGCDNNDDCKGDDVCVTADNGKKYCSRPDDDIEEECKDNPSTDNCCKHLYACAEHGCVNDSDCEGDLVCVRKEGDGAGTCAMNDEDIKDTCMDNPSYANCCEQPPEAPELPRAGGLPPTLLFTLGGIILVALGLLF